MSLEQIKPRVLPQLLGRSEVRDSFGRIPIYRDIRFHMAESELGRQITLLDFTTETGAVNDLSVQSFADAVSTTGTAVVAVHPLFFGRSIVVNHSETLAGKYERYSDRFFSLIHRAQKAGIPCLIYLEIAEEDSSELGWLRLPFMQRSMNESQQSLRRAFKGFNEEIPGTLFVLMTHGGSPTPRVSQEAFHLAFHEPTRFMQSQNMTQADYPSLYELFQKNRAIDLYRGIHRLLSVSFVHKLKQAGLKKIILSGSYFGGGKKLKPNEYGKGERFVDPKTGDEVTLTPGSGFYRSASLAEQIQWLALDDVYKREGKDSHIFTKIMPRGCAGAAAYHYAEAGIRVGLSKSFFPEPPPLLSNLRTVVDEFGDEYFLVDS